MSEQDIEVSVIGECWTALARLSPAQQQRALGYLTARIKGIGENLDKDLDGLTREIHETRKRTNALMEEIVRPEAEPGAK